MPVGTRYYIPRLAILPESFWWTELGAQTHTHTHTHTHTIILTVCVCMFWIIWSLHVFGKYCLWFLVLPSSCSVLLCADLERLKVFGATTTNFLGYSLLMFNQGFITDTFLKTFKSNWVNQESFCHGGQHSFFNISAG